MDARRLTTLTIATVLTALSALPGQAQHYGDFNGDGYSDLAIGVPNETVGRTHEAGAVNVIYGSAGNGLRAVGNQIWHQNSPGIGGVAENNDRFGYSLATGDFNADGYSDLAVGVVNEGIGLIDGAGQVNVIYGSEAGLVADGNQVFHQNVDGVEDDAEFGDNFGFTLAVGDFNRDGYDDLAVGAPGESLPALARRVNADGIQQFDEFGVEIFDPVDIARAGAVHVFFGTEEGLTAEGDQIFHQQVQYLDVASRVTGIFGVAWGGDEFGSALAAGDFNGDRASDLAVGVRGEELSFVFVRDRVVVTVEHDLPHDTGAVTVLFSDWAGLSPVGHQFLHQNVLGTQAIAEAGDGFGTSLAAGDFNGDTYDDLAVGVPFEDVARLPDAGAAHVIYGFHEGLVAEHDWFVHQDITDVKGGAAEGELFGLSLSAADYDGDGYEDLAVGVPRDSVGPTHGAGSVNVFYGHPDGCTVEGNQRWHQRSPGIQEQAEAWDQFGNSLASGDFDGDGFYDLAVGVFNESRLGFNGAGAINVLYGRRNVGLRAGGNQLWDQARRSIEDRAEPVDWFGFSLASGN